METTEIITIGTLSIGAIIAFVRLETKVANMKESHTEHKHDVAQKFKDVEKDRKDVEGSLLGAVFGILGQAGWLDSSVRFLAKP